MTNGKVVLIGASGETILNERGVNDDCVTSLEGLLQKAKDGEITGICGAVQYVDHSTGTVMAGFTWNSALIGCLMRMVYSLSQE